MEPHEFMFDVKHYWENRLRSNFGLHGVGCLGFGMAYNKILYKIRKIIFKRMLNILDVDYQNCSVIDIGCGTGFYIERWMETGIKTIVGVDITKVSVERLQERFTEAEFYQVDISDTYSIPGQELFDIASAFDVLFHITDDNKYRQAFKNVNQLLKMGGYFIFSEAILHNEAERELHIVKRPLEDIITILTEAGFRVIKRIPMFFIMDFSTDSKSKLFRFLLKCGSYFVRRNETAGLFAGTILFPFERLLTSISKGNPTTEMMVCKKIKDIGWGIVKEN